MDKKVFISFILLIFMATPLFADMNLFYNIYWGPFRIGVAEIQIKKNYYKAITYTVGLGNFFYPYYAEWTTFIDEKGMPVKSEIYSRHGKKERKKIISFDKKAGKVIYQKVLPRREKAEVINATYPLYDELSAFVDSFYLNYTKQKEWKFPIMVKGKKAIIVVQFEKEVFCPKTQILNKKSRCLLLLVNLPQKSELLKHSKKVEVYLETNNRVPVYLKGHLPILGSLKAKIEKIKKSGF